MTTRPEGPAGLCNEPWKLYLAPRTGRSAGVPTSLIIKMSFLTEALSEGAQSLDSNIAMVTDNA